MKKSTKPQKTPLPESAKKEYSKKVPDEFRDKVQAAVERISEILGVDHFHFRIFYGIKPADSPHETFQDGIIGATTSIDLRYLKAEIRCYPYMLEQWVKGELSEKEMEDIIAHEVAHIVTEGLRKLAMEPFKTEDQLRDSAEILTTIVGRLANRIDRNKKGTLDK